LLEANEGFLGFVAFIVKQYLLQYESSDAPVSFDSPDFRQAITSALEYRNLLDTPTVGRDPLIMTYHQYYGVGFNDSDEVISIPPPALTPDSPRMVKASMELFILNPLSKNQQAALDFLSFYADNMDVNNKYSLNATLDTPVRQERFDEDQQGIHDQIANLEQMMKTAEDAEKVDYQAIIDREKTRYEKRESDLWLITQESIGIYQKIAADLVVPSRSIFSNDRGSPNDQVIEQVIARFADGQISVDQFIQELNKKAQMMFMEGK
jgi:ABC-type glycerol-3-phosphate transport system substrate-binding protein